MILHTLPDIQSVSEAIHDAVAPVFLITGIGSILSVLVNRLGRAVDRARIINDMPIKEKKPTLMNSILLLEGQLGLDARLA